MRDSEARNRGATSPWNLFFHPWPLHWLSAPLLWRHHGCGTAERHWRWLRDGSCGRDGGAAVEDLRRRSGGVCSVGFGAAGGFGGGVQRGLIIYGAAYYQNILIVSFAGCSAVPRRMGQSHKFLCQIVGVGRLARREKFWCAPIIFRIPQKSWRE